MQTKAELSRAIQKDLKNAGIRKSDYRIATKSAGFDREVTVTITNPETDIKTIRTILNSYHRISRNVYGDVERGGNTYTKVQIADFVPKTQFWSHAKGILSGTTAAPEGLEFDPKRWVVRSNMQARRVRGIREFAKTLQLYETNRILG